MADVRFEYATRRFPGTDRPAVDALDVHVQDGELLVLVGPSGSGKSTALRMLAGLEEVDEGGIWLGERDVTQVPAQERDLAMVFQSYALYPYLDVAANIAFPLKMAKVPKAERANGDLLLPLVRSILDDQLPYPPRVETSSLGDAAVLTGAMAVGVRAARENVFARRNGAP